MRIKAKFLKAIMRCAFKPTSYDKRPVLQGVGYSEKGAYACNTFIAAWVGELDQSRNVEFNVNEGYVPSDPVKADKIVKGANAEDEIELQDLDQYRKEDGSEAAYPSGYRVVPENDALGSWVYFDAELLITIAQMARDITGKAKTAVVGIALNKRGPLRPVAFKAFPYESGAGAINGVVMPFNPAEYTPPFQGRTD